jgi:hypothetical protein
MGDAVFGSARTSLSFGPVLQAARPTLIELIKRRERPGRSMLSIYHRDARRAAPS